MFTNILISLDEIFDVRTATWQELVTTEQFTSMIDAGYGVRRTDRWDQYVKYSEYTKKYAQRNTESLRNSTVTGIIKLLDSTLVKFAEVSHSNPTVKSPVLYIDFPKRYTLTDEEINTICGMVHEQLSTDPPLKVLRSSRTFTPSDFKQMELGVVFMYDVVHWVEDFATSNVVTKEMVSPYTSVVCAQVHTSDTPFSEKGLERAASALQEMLEPCVNVQFVNAGLFTSPFLVELY